MASKKSSSSKNPGRRAAWLRMWGIVLLPLTLFPILSILTYDWRDIPRLHTPPNHPPNNMIGIAGAWSVYAAYTLLGLAVWLLPVWVILFAVTMLRARAQHLLRKLAWILVVTLGASGLFQLGSDLFAPLGSERFLNIGPNAGGMAGYYLVSRFMEPLMGRVGAVILLVSLCLLGIVMALGPHNLVDFWVGLYNRGKAWRAAHADRTARLEREERRLRKKLHAEQKEAERAARRAEQEQRRQEKAAEQARRAEEREERRRMFEERRRELEAKRADTRSASAGETPPAGAPESPDPVIRDPHPPADDAAAPAVANGETPAPGPAAEPDANAKESAAEGTAYTDNAEEVELSYTLPPPQLLDAVDFSEARGPADTEITAQILVDTLGEFGLQVEVTDVECGPVVTRYELLPAPGIRVERIARLASTLELTLKATSIRVQAPIPGKGVVGIEVPNEVAHTVTVREIVDGKLWKANKAEIPLVLGKDVSGNDMVADLARMPHLLIAGATGSGKSVCINAILAGLLMSRRPQELRLMLVDPKIVEFAVYNDLPHLVVPVITDPKKVALGLRWAILEMERRYKLLAEAGVRNIASYNRRQTTVQPDMFEETDDPGNATDKPAPPAKLPYIVIVIDELADLMLVAGQEIEASIARIAQLSRAVGIHMILATQRPSVNVITGTIKANFPGRIAFQVAQKVDSRTILDAQGAESLIGRGDMLFLNPWTSKLERAQGALIQDSEIVRLVSFIKEQTRPVFVKSVYEDGPDAGDGSGAGAGAAGTAGLDEVDDADEKLLRQATEVIRETRRASTSSLQRRLRIGYNRAARLMDALEERGIIGPPRGSDPREILVDFDGEIPNNDPEEPIES